MNLKTEREKRGITQQTVARAMGLTQPNYARIESGQREPTKQQAKAFKNAMLLYDNGHWPEVLEGT